MITGMEIDLFVTAGPALAERLFASARTGSGESKSPADRGAISSPGRLASSRWNMPQDAGEIPAQTVI
jgi:hypothetical protein